MAILLKCNALFLHVPKTGGTWVREVLKELDLVEEEFSHEHADMERVLHLSGHYPGQYFRLSLKYLSNFERKILNSYKFCFVRDPISWYKSYWRFMKDNDYKNFNNLKRKSRFGLKSDLWHPWQVLHDCISPDFNTFISNVVKKEPGFLVKMYNSYALKPHVDFVGTQENLKADLIKILKKCNCDFDVNIVKSYPFKNSSRTEMPEYRPDLKDELMKLEYPVFYEYYNK